LILVRDKIKNNPWTIPSDITTSTQLNTIAAKILNTNIKTHIPLLIFPFHAGINLDLALLGLSFPFVIRKTHPRLKNALYAQIGIIREICQEM
jgi:hypothetical protein